jgi:AMMECR1 domain-containing protein/orotate phosphoribosyltransferase
MKKAETHNRRRRAKKVEDHADLREQLRLLLKEQGILYASPTQPILGRDGSTAPWAFYSWHVSLTSAGLRLAALNLLERLRQFRATQLASYGYTGMPLLSACVLMGEGRYTGVCVREKRKAYLSCRRVEGPVDKSRPVIVIDDSLSSGTSLHKAITALEEDGFEVEGAVALVHFPNRGGLEWANAYGYHVECLFDIWDDLEMPRPSLTPDFHRFNDFPVASIKIKDGLHPATVARRTAEIYLSTGRMPRPPKRLDYEYDNRGGVYVSFRERDTETRLARDGFWHFNPADADLCRDLVLATIQTLDSAAGAITLQTLPALKIAVTFFPALELIKPRQLDFDRYGIVVQSRDCELKRGGALPNTQVFISEVEQYRHARERNARVASTEPHNLYRHEVVKCVEPGEDWLPYGSADGPDTAWSRDDSIGARLTERALRVITAALQNKRATGEPLPDDSIQTPIYGIAVTLYQQGLIGYGIATGGTLDSCLRQAARQAVADERFKARRKRAGLRDVSVMVSVLYGQEQLGQAPLNYVATKIRRGLDSVSVTCGERHVVFLPGAITYNNWTKEHLVKAMLGAAGVEESSGAWSTYKTAVWLRSRHGLFPLRFGFPIRSARAYDSTQCRRDIELLGNFIVNNLGPGGLPEYYQNPITDEHSLSGTAPRVIHALLSLSQAGRLLKRPEWQAAALKGFRHCLKFVDRAEGTLNLPEHDGGALADCVLLAGVAECGGTVLRQPEVKALAARVSSMFQADGRISDYQTNLQISQDHDYLPGAALWSLANYLKRSRARGLPDSLDWQLAWYRRRFRLLHTWGMAGWQTQGWEAMYQLTSDKEQAAFVFEAADWALDHQLEKNGAFLEDLSPTEPSFNTGFIAEGIAAAWSLALQVGDTQRALRYAQSWREAMSFITTLIIYPEDTFCMPNAQRAIGGVRCTQTRSDVRVDQVSHCLHAMIAGARLLERHTDGEVELGGG